MIVVGHAHERARKALGGVLVVVVPSKGPKFLQQLRPPKTRFAVHRLNVLKEKETSHKLLKVTMQNL